MDDLTQNQIDDLLEQLREQQDDSKPGFTSQEVADRLDISQKRARDRLRKLLAEGKIKPTMLWRGNEDGYLREGKVHGYVLTG